MAIDDGGERGGQIGLWINAVEFAGLNKRGDGRPILGSSVMAREECVLPVQRNAPFILPMSAMKLRFFIAGILILASGFPFAVLKNERQAGF